MPHDNLTPLQKLEAIPKVWLVWYSHQWLDDSSSFIASFHRTEAGAKAYVDKQLVNTDDYSIEWQELLD